MEEISEEIPQEEGNIDEYLNEEFEVLVRETVLASERERDC